MLRGMVATPSHAGHLLMIGGAEDKLRQRQILSRFVSLAGRSDGQIAIISTASSLGDEATELYVVAVPRHGRPGSSRPAPADPRRGR